VRVAELTWSPSTGLPHVEVDDRGGWVLHVQGKGGKQRRIPLPKRLVEVLQGYRVARGCRRSRPVRWLRFDTTSSSFGGASCDVAVSATG
jgi:integrase